MKVIIDCALNGVMYYPGYYEDEQGRGDHIMVSPPFIITEEQVDQCVEVLQAALDKYQEELL